MAEGLQSRSPLVAMAEFGIGATGVAAHVAVRDGTHTHPQAMFELNKRYGMKKFVIVVPSIAIREGVLHSIETMRGHFESFYDVHFEHFVYDSARLTAIHSFATSDMMQVMVINIQAFS